MNNKNELLVMAGNEVVAGSREYDLDTYLNKWWDREKIEIQILLFDVFNSNSFWEQLPTSVKWNIHRFLTAKNQENELQEDEEKYHVKIISGKLAEVALYFQRGIPVEMMYDEHGCFYEIFQDSFNKFYDVIENRLNDYIPTGSNESEYETIKITFSKPIHDVNKMFDDAEHWGVSNLKGWIENYESSRFTQIDERSAIITAEYNMQYIKEWLMQNVRMDDSIEIII